jgi:hypothetical protein
MSSNNNLSGGYITTTTGLGGNYITTSSILNTSILNPISNRYNILGEEVDLEIGDYNGSFAITIATLNVLGRPFYEELKKQPISLSNEVIEIIERRLIITERERKINSVINKE